MLRQRLMYVAAVPPLLVMMGVGLMAHAAASTGRAPLAAPVKKVLIKEAHQRYGYTPTKITVARGTKVTWTNKTDVEHNVSDEQNGMKVNKDIKQGKTVNFTFTKAGTYHYHCEYHPYMKGTIVVK